MDLHFLTEAKTRSRWKRETQQQAGQGTWSDARVTKFGPNVSWRTKVRQIAYDLRLSTAVKKHVLQTLEHLERTHGAGYVDKLTDPQLYYAVKMASHKYSTLTRPVPRELRKSTISSIYKQASTLNIRTGFKHPDPEVQAYAEKSKQGVGSGDQLRANVADVPLGALTKAELEKHKHPDVKKMYGAISPYRSKIQRDKAVVWNSEGTPYYMFAQLMKTRAEGPAPEANDPKFYDFLLPRSLDFQRKGVPLGHLGKYKKNKHHDLSGAYNKNTDWRGQYRSEELRKLNLVRGAGTATIKPIQKDSLANAAVYAQQIALAKAKPFIAFRKEYLQTRAILDAFERIEKKMALTSEQEQVRRAAFKRYEHAKKGLAKLGDSYTWFLYLLALEDEHGVQLGSRQSEHPNWPKTRSEVKGQTKHWTIQYTGSEDIPKWDTTILAKAGYPTHSLAKFYDDLARSVYKLGPQSQRAVNHLWIPIGGSLEKLGLHSHKVNIDDYIEKARAIPAEYIFGWEGRAINVRKTMSSTHMYKFSGGNPRRSFALIPAMEYLRWFDSPAHSGVRFIHGQEKLAAAHREFDADDPFKEAGRRKPRTKLQKRAQSYRETRVLRRPEHPAYYPDIFTKDFSHDMEKRRAERIKASAELIARTITRQRKKARGKVDFAARKAERTQRAERVRRGDIARELATGATSREAANRVRAFRQRASHLFPGMSFAIRDDKGRAVRWADPSTRAARERPYATRTVGQVIGKVSSKAVSSPTVGVKPQMPLPTWRDYLGSTERNPVLNWEANWKRKHPNQKRFLLKRATKQQLKQQSREDYKKKVKSYVRQAHDKGFIVIDSTGNPVELSQLRISDRDLV